MNDKIAITAIAVLAVSTLAACGGDTEQSTTGERTTPQTTAPASTAESPVQGETPSDSPSSSETAEEKSPAQPQPEPGSPEDAALARSIAVKQVAAEGHDDGVVVAQDLEESNNRWEVDVLAANKRYEVQVNTADSSAKIDEIEDADDEDRAAAKAAVTIAAAIDAAVAHTAGIIENVDWDDGHWQVEIRPDGSNDEAELTVDPKSGSVSQDDD